MLYHYEVIGTKLIIGKFCSIAPEVRFMMDGGNHRMDGSTYPFNLFGNGWEAFTPSLDELPIKGDTVIGNDVWIGRRATIMPGVRIGRCDHCGRICGDQRCGTVHDRRRQSRKDHTQKIFARGHSRAAGDQMVRLRHRTDQSIYRRHRKRKNRRVEENEKIRFINEWLVRNKEKAA